MTYDVWKTDPDYDDDVAKAWLRRMLGDSRRDPDDARLEREDQV